MNNKENYKKAINQIHPSEKLKRNTFEKCVQKPNNKYATKKQYIKLLTACAIFLIAFMIGVDYLDTEKEDVNIPNVVNTKQIAKEKNSTLPRFKSMQELRDVLKETDYYRYSTNKEGIVLTTSTIKSEAATDSMNSAAAIEEKESALVDYSTTNVQVENVDEADIVKTDGEFIYYITNGEILVVKAENLELVAKITNKEDLNPDKNFSPNEIFVSGNTLVALGNEFTYETSKTQTNTNIEEAELEDALISYDYARIKSNRTAKAIIYDITNKENPVIKREINLDGYYSNSRMIGEYVYFISTKGAYYRDGLLDNDILPIYKDTAVSNETKRIAYSDIAYFEGTDSQSFTLVAGFNINNNEEIFLETFFGASDTIYASEKNMYLSQVSYNDYKVEKSTIYKFNLDNGAVILECKGEVKGNLNNQFAMDEYEGNLRIATTDYSGEKTVNQVYILDENLKEIGKVENMAPDEKIYSVRFIGKIGYVVTFKQIDPLFVLDLSDPRNPVIKGELKIPGYSSYLHPYDENHIIGIGYNTETNKYGGTTNTSIKMSMFDVSDLENPTEIFNVNIGNRYSYSEIINNHKALFYNKNKNLIGFPVTIRNYSANNDTDNFIVFKIDLEKGFEEYGRISQKIDYRTNINRSIYIKDTLYTLSETQMVSYNLNTMEKLNTLKFEDTEKENNEIYTEEITY